MTEKQIRNKGQIVTLILLLSLILMTLVGYVIGKYVDDKALEGRVIFTASLAENVILQEHTAQQQADGSYQLTEPFVTGNDYVLIPGLDIPKDPHILIEGKTNIPAYLFVEVVDVLGNDALTWAVDDTLWEPVPDTQGVYVYKTVLDSTPDAPIYILKDNQIVVSQHLNCDGRTTNGTLTFRVKLVQKYENADPKQAYNGYND